MQPALDSVSTPSTHDAQATALDTALERPPWQGLHAAQAPAAQSATPALVAPANGALWRQGLSTPAAWLARCFGIASLERHLQDVARAASIGAPLGKAALKTLGVTLRVDASETKHIPMEGGFVAVANHPTGGVDGLAALAALETGRRDIRILGNRWLSRVPGIADLLLPLDVFAAHAPVNLRALRQALRWLRQGHGLLIFPAGEVAQASLASSQSLEAPWQTTAATLARVAKAPLLPIHLSGELPRPTQLLGTLNAHLRAALLVRSLRNQRGRHVQVRIGRPWRIAEQGGRPQDERHTRLLRAATLTLPALHAQAPLARRAAQRPVAKPHAAARLDTELAALPQDCTLLTTGDYAVYAANAAQIPQIMHAIGCAREATFRASGEGTGASLDLDPYDAYYTQLFVWHRTRSCLVGAYRMLPSDTVEDRGAAGFYTHSLFHYDRRFLDALGPCLELGRAFVAPAYQGTPRGLFLLWRGIGTYLVRNPRYRTLFGPVSLPAAFGPVMASWIAHLLSTRFGDTALRALVRPRHGLACTQASAGLRAEGGALRSVSELAALTTRLHPAGLRLPMLFEQYAMLGGRFLCSSVDEAFSAALDTLMVLRLEQAPRDRLARYMTPEGSATYLRAGLSLSPRLPRCA